MRKSLLLACLLSLAACGGPEAPPTAAGSEPADEATGEIVTQSETHLVANPPTYESVPLPDGLVWVTNEDDPVYASPEAKRGGTFRSYMTGFPLTLRQIGPDANSDEFVSIKRAGFVGLVDLHPNTLNFTP